MNTRALQVTNSVLHRVYEELMFWQLNLIRKGEGAILILLDSAPMNPENPIHARTTLRRFSSHNYGSQLIQPLDGWSHPPFDFDGPPRPIAPIPTKLYLVPTLDRLEGEEAVPHDEFSPVPTPLSKLPDIETWIKKYVLTTVEIWDGRRPVSQLARWSHRRVYQQIAENSYDERAKPKIRKIYIQEPIEGVAESMVTLRFGERVRSLTLRFEGVDERWLCTEFKLL